MSTRRSQAPPFRDHHRVAMLDPCELAVGVDPSVPTETRVETVDSPMPDDLFTAAGGGLVPG